MLDTNWLATESGSATKQGHLSTKVSLEVNSPTVRHQNANYAAGIMTHNLNLTERMLRDVNSLNGISRIWKFTERKFRNSMKGIFPRATSKDGIFGIVIVQESTHFQSC